MRARLFAACALLLVAWSCGGASSTIDVTAPTTVKCEVTVANSLSGAAPFGGTSGTLTVTTTRDCTWTTATSTPWIALSSATSGQGSGTVGYTIAANGEPSQRRASIDVNNTQVLIIQDPAPCRFSVTPANTTVSANGGAVTVAVETLAGCSWSATTDASWIALPPNPTGTKSGSVVVNVAANDGGARTGTVHVGDATATISQSALPPPPPPTPAPAPAPPAPPEPEPPAPTPSPAPTPPPCTYGISPASANVTNTGGSGSVSVTTVATCAWTAVSNDSWLTVTSGASGTGSGTVGYLAAANSGSARSGTIAIAGKAFAVSQAAAPAPCTFTISPTSQTITEAGGTGSISVTASAGSCAWTASSNASWITIGSGASGTGNGTVAFTVAANTGAARTGTITAAGKTFTVSQAAAPPPPPPPCTFSIAPTDQSVGDAGGSGSFAVTASAATCAWTAASNAGWITISSGASGTGNGTVAFNVAANTGAARTGTITAAGNTFTVSQAAPPAPPPPPPPCTFTLDRSSQTFASGGGSATVSVTASGSSCTWTAASNADWIAVTSGASGTGNGSVAFTASPNSGAARSGTITIAGQTFTVSEDAAPPM